MFVRFKNDCKPYASMHAGRGFFKSKPLLAKDMYKIGHEMKKPDSSANSEGFLYSTQKSSDLLNVALKII